MLKAVSDQHEFGSKERVNDCANEDQCPHEIKRSEELVNFCCSIGAQESGCPPRILITSPWSCRRHVVSLASTYAGDVRPRTRR
jgi:hypothetical protein